uniref:Uncharacterized protein n=1 Tax=Knipowitschia caucasica TaxID=637954 RepID=A0AAV2M6E8_KNICA
MIVVYLLCFEIRGRQPLDEIRTSAGGDFDFQQEFSSHSDQRSEGRSVCGFPLLCR